MSERREELMEAINRAAVKGIEAAASKRATDIKPADVAQAKPQIESEVAKAVALSPEVQHVTNTEIWYTKRSRWGAIIGPLALVIGVGLRLFGIEYSFGLAEQGLLADGLTALGVLIGAWFSYQAGVATKPLGS